MAGFKLDRLDLDAMERIRETPIWAEFEGRIRDRLAAAQRNCLNSSLEEKDIRVAQGEVAAISFVLGLPDAIQREVVRKTNGPNTAAV